MLFFVPITEKFSITDLLIQFIKLISYNNQLVCNDNVWMFDFVFVLHFFFMEIFSATIRMITDDRFNVRFKSGSISMPASVIVFN